MKKFKSADNRFAVIIETEQLNKIVLACKKAKRFETGGILIGKYTDKNKNLLIMQVGDPPDDSQFGFTWFIRGFKDIQGWLNTLWQDGAGYYVGEWHFHPFSSSTPSAQDLKQLKGISHNIDYKCPEPVLLIMGGDPSKKWTLSATIAQSNGEILRLTEV